MIRLPKSICGRWSKHVKVQKPNFAYRIASALAMAKTTKEVFMERWGVVRAHASADELFCLFKDAGFGSSKPTTGDRAKFITNILKRYEDIQQEPVCHACGSLLCVRMCCTAFIQQPRPHLLLHWHSYAHRSYISLHSHLIVSEKNKQSCAGESAKTHPRKMAKTRRNYTNIN